MNVSETRKLYKDEWPLLMTKLIDHVRWLATYGYPVTGEDAENMIEDSILILNQLRIPLEK